ncbi:MAG TPA: substrate-binding domain-containing protein [Vicinamibacterales bacterium]|jgi:molybdate transport system substrate-binding protein|nr:substrate-binding domain-containing protein [Vicinamibacterales bacterium]
MTLLACAARSALVALVLLSGVLPARADDVKVLSSVAMRAVVEELAQRFEREGRHHVVTTFGLAAAMKSRIEAGEAFDLVIVTPAQIDDLIKQGKAAAASRAVIARTGLGLMVRAGSPKLDVGTVDAFKRTLLTAKSLTYVPAGASGVAFLATAKQLGIADALAAKTKAGASGEEVNANITGGAAEIAVLPVSEILPVKGATLGGVFPADVQTYIVMAGATSTTASPAARDFLALLTSAASDAVITAKGMERVKP